MRFLVVLLALLAVGVLSGPAAAAGDPTSAQAAALDRLQAASSTPVAADFEDGIARYVSGTVPADGASATERALSFLDRFRDLYGLSEPRSQLQVVRQAGEGDAQDVFFGESVRGVPVENAQLAVHLLGGAVVSTNGAYLPVLPAAMKPAVTAAKAVAAAQSAAGIAADPVVPPALAYFNAGLTMTAVEREIWHLDDATHLVWRVTLPTRVSYVDAFSGRELLGLRPAVDAATSLRIGSATGRPSAL